MLSLVFLSVFNFGLLVFTSCVNYITEKESLIPKITSFWKAHQNNVVVNTVVVDQSIYARNAMMPYTLIVLRTVIHETQNLLLSFLSEVLIM